ncbi:hypothetical protein A3B35_03635 [Candidatus Kaiserbacteria bacterium RIFCSPLOWO2_01_FULL_54_24]|uniref:DUF1761 domain-containing protein n=1 Tax=Candidatus Kaiserbacteria bacterium RIFCSPLOWO2_01_FULL_54_24 TaxID=1798515 RepID=A0A1F6EV49_9BACT|nr:MAG: hypothetical protein A3B35_03635 [Candidatus Kaiserbacteria bacterium RIFCSPLOWO2_01_FULL_54_24]
MIEVTFLPVFFAGITSVVIGFVWYHPRVFGSMWMRLANLSPESVEKGKRLMPVMAFFGLLASMLTAYVMNYFAIAWVVYDVIGAIELGFWCWAGFVATTTLSTVLWEQRSFKLYLINASYSLVSFIAMAIVLLLASV